MGVILFIVSFVLSLILYPIALFTSVVINFRKTRFRIGFKKFNAQLLEIATGIDATGNVVCEDLFNICLVKKDGYKFGNRKETVSSVLGKNQLVNKLTVVGLILAGILDAIEKDHCIKSIDNLV